jgi:hypothetical protein
MSFIRTDVGQKKTTEVGLLRVDTRHRTTGMSSLRTATGEGRQKCVPPDQLQEREGRQK